MSFKNTFKKNLKDTKSLLSVKYEGSKGVFIFVSFLFFVSFFMIGAGYKRDFLLTFLSPMYILLLVSLNLFLYYFLRLRFSEKPMLAYIIMLVFVVFSVLALSVII